MESLPRYGCMGDPPPDINEPEYEEWSAVRDRHEAYMEQLQLQEELEQNRKDVDLENARWELIRKYYPRWIDDYCPVTDLNESIEPMGSMKSLLY